MKLVYSKEFLDQIRKMTNDHKKRVKKILDDVKANGVSNLKYLLTLGEFKIYEAKVARPPYRLYFAYDVEEDKLYVIEWAHKKRQPKLIKKIKFVFSKS